jgi:hypothetical protein
MAKQKQLDFDKDIAKFTGRQMESCAAIDSKLYKFILYGGALGGGKSYWLRWTLVRLLMTWFFEKGLTKVKTMLACEDYPQLKDRQIEKIETEFPAWLGKSYSDHKVYGRCYILDAAYGSGIICFRNLDDPSKYQSSEWATAAIDELTKNDYHTFTEIRKRLRWPGLEDDECLLLGATNPGGIGHNYCKSFWIKGEFPPEFLEPYDYSKKFKYIPAKAEDNPHLPPAYWQMLHTLPAHQRKAFKDGSWDLFEGQAFQEWSILHHVIKPQPVPKDVPLFMTFDWGFGAPFSVGWWWIDSDGRFYRFAEWYGWNGTQNHGLRLSDSEIAQGIIKKEKAMGFEVEKDGVVNPQITRLCDPTCFNKKPDYKGGGQGQSTAEEFRHNGLVLRPGDASRVLKWRQMHQRLNVPDITDEFCANKEGFHKSDRGLWYNEKGEHITKYGVPMLQVYSSCNHFIRTVPDLVTNPNNIEDIDTDGEDHVADEVALICMARPLSQGVWKETLHEKKHRPQDISEVAHRELQNVIKSLDTDYTIWERI